MAKLDKGFKERPIACVSNRVLHFFFWGPPFGWGFKGEPTGTPKSMFMGSKSKKHTPKATKTKHTRKKQRRVPPAAWGFLGSPGRWHGGLGKAIGGEPAASKEPRLAGSLLALRAEELLSASGNVGHPCLFWQKGTLLRLLLKGSPNKSHLFFLGSSIFQTHACG